MTVGESVTINGSISFIRMEVNVTIYYSLSGGAWSTLTMVTTDVDGRYSYDWTSTIAGTYEVKASWEGNDNILAAESVVWTVTVKEPATNIYLYAVMAVAVVIAVSATVVYVVKIRKPKPAHTQKT